MRETYKMRGWLSLSLIIVLFFSGICFDRGKTDPYFALPFSTASEMLQTVQQNGDKQDICASEQLGDSMLRGAAEVLKRTGAGQRNKTFSRLRSVLHAGAVCLNVNSSIYYRKWIETEKVIVSCKSVIISYIHQQDGSKG